MKLQTKIFNPRLIAILILAAVLRFWYLGSLPAGLHYSEAQVGWRAQNIARFGRDEFGRRFPLIFSNGKELELPVATYISVPFVSIAPKNPFFLKFPFAVIGIFGVLGAIFLTRRLFPDKKHLDLLVGLVVAVNPWGVWLSRIVSPEILVFTFFIWGIYFVLSKGRFKYLGVICLILSLFSSTTALFFVLPFVILFFLKQTCLFFLKQTCLLFFRNFPKVVLAPVFIAWLFVLLLLLRVPGGWIDIKENYFSMFGEIGYANNINVLRGNELAGGVPVLGKVFFNKGFYLTLAIENFLSHFNPSFLFAAGDGTSLHGPSNFGPILLIFFPFFIIGIWIFFKHWVKKSVSWIIVPWMFFATFPSLFLADGPHTDRFLPALYPMSLIIALGFLHSQALFLSLKRLVFTILLVIAITFNIIFVSYDVVVKEDLRTQDVWHTSTIELADYLKDKTSRKIWITDMIDSNPGPVFAYLYEIPYTSTNLANLHGSIYHLWVNSIDNMKIGGGFKNMGGFEIMAASSSELTILPCRSKITQIGKKKNAYYIMEGCQ